MQQTASRAKKTAKSNGRGKATPDLMGALSKGQRKAEKKTLTADQIADCIEKEAKRLQRIADILRGKA